MVRRRWLEMALVGLVACVPAGAAKISALVVGADAYAQENNLLGADNDAKLLAAALRAAGAVEVRTLLDTQVTRKAVLDNFRALAAKSGPGDWLVFSYAGHGWREPETYRPHRHADGWDNAILLPGFSRRAPGADERIRDFEFAELFAAVPPQVKILFIADSCYSGTLTREIAPGAGPQSFRHSEYGPIKGDLLPPPAAGPETDELPNMVFAAAALDTQTSPEVPIGGEMHGALSWFVARGISGAADQNGDGVTTLAEFRSYVTASVRFASESQQTPDVRYVAGRGSEVLPFQTTGAEVLPGAAVAVGVWVEGGGAGLIAGYPGMVSAPAESAQLKWNPTTGEVFRGGDRIAQNIVNAAALAGVADKVRALQALYELSSRHEWPIGIVPGGSKSLHRTGEEIVFNAEPPANPALRWFTAFNLAGDGRVQRQYPNTMAEVGAQPAGTKLNFRSKVLAPYGADHLVVIATAGEPIKLRETLRTLEGKPAAGEAARAVIEALRGKPYVLGVAQLYTGP